VTPVATSVAATSSELTEPALASAEPTAEPPVEDEAQAPPGLTGQVLFPPLDSDPSSSFPPLPCRGGAKTVIGRADGKMSQVAIAATPLGVLAAWADRPPDPTLPDPDLPGSGALHVQPLDARGTPKDASTKLSLRTNGDLALFPLDDGTFLLSYEEWGSVGGALLLHVDASGDELGAPVDRPKPDDVIAHVSSSGRRVAVILRNYTTDARTLLRIDTSREPMRVIAEDLPDTAEQVSTQMRPDGRVWLLSGKTSGPVHIRLSAKIGSEPTAPVQVSEWGSVLLGPQEDLVLVDSGSDQELDVWRIHAGQQPAKYHLRRAIAPGSARLSFDPSGQALKILSGGAGLTLAREVRPMFWQADSAWTGSSYLAIYVDAGQGQTRNVVVQSVTCDKPKAK